MLTGDYYPLTACRKDPHDFYAMQFDDPTRRMGFIQVIRNTQTEQESITVQPMVRGEGVYELENMENGECRRLLADGLKNGFTVTLPKRTGIIWFYRY